MVSRKWKWKRKHIDFWCSTSIARSIDWLIWLICQQMSCPCLLCFKPRPPSTMQKYFRRPEKVKFFSDSQDDCANLTKWHLHIFSPQNFHKKLNFPFWLGHHFQFARNNVPCPRASPHVEGLPWLLATIYQIRIRTARCPVHFCDIFEPSRAFLRKSISLQHPLDLNGSFALWTRTLQSLSFFHSKSCFFLLLE